MQQYPQQQANPVAQQQQLMQPQNQSNIMAPQMVLNKNTCCLLHFSKALFVRPTGQHIAIEF